MLRRVAPSFLLALGALACSLTGGGAPTNAPNSLATSAAATLTALVLPASSATPSPAPAVTQAPPASSTPTTAPSATTAPATATGAATAAPTAAATVAAPATTAPAGCKLAYADKDTLYCVPDSGTPKTLATGSGLFGPALSPDGSLIAYQVVITEGVTQLWVAAISEGGAVPHVLVGQDQLPSADGRSAQINSPNHYAWLAGTHTLVFDTRYMPTGGPGGPGEYINADLWKVDADTGAVAALLPAGQAGFFSASPDGHTIAISRGTGLDLLNADGSNHHQDVVTFPAIVTYSEYTFKPRPQWSADGSFFTVAIPSKDPLAADSSVAFYKVGANGTVTPRGTHPGNYVFGSPVPPEIAPDGGHVVYAKVDPSGPTPVALHLLTIQSDSFGDNTFDHQESAGGGWGWAPDSQHYAYDSMPPGGSGRVYVVDTTGAAPQILADNLAGTGRALWVDNTHLVYMAQFNGGGWALYRQALGSAPQSVANGLTAQANFDVRP